MAGGVLEEILKKGQDAGLAEMTTREKTARTWFKRQAERVKYLNEANVKDFLDHPPRPENLKGRVIPGHMYLFQYDAKLKMELPYWDSFPLIFPIEIYDDGFLGINFHYLSHEYRAKLMDALYGLAFNNQYSEEYRLRISYDILKNASKYKYFKPCIKRYLRTHLRSRFYNIEWQEWPIALFLPYERFRTQTRFASSRQVWEDSARKIKGS
jgi:hypothetical protein